MADSDWLTLRTPPPPAELAEAIRAALKARNITGAAPTPTALLETAQSLLEKVLQTDCAERESALDLLTADALVTYALEMANEMGREDYSAKAMQAVAGVAPPRDSTA